MWPGFFTILPAHGRQGVAHIGPFFLTKSFKLAIIDNWFHGTNLEIGKSISQQGARAKCWKSCGAASIGARSAISCPGAALNNGMFLVGQQIAAQLTTSGDQWRESHSE
jgi:hypothetical protein